MNPEPCQTYADVRSYRDDLESYMELQGAAQPGLLVLTTGLSKPFRRLDKYSAMLQELERHMETGHPDRGDTQRGIVVYKDIAVGVIVSINVNRVYILENAFCARSPPARRRAARRSSSCRC